jgi:creatinine amidohydrolase
MAFTASASSTIINLYSIEVDDLLEGPPEGEHGGEMETSLLLHLAPNRVRTDLIADFTPDPRTFRRYVRGRVPTPPPGSRGTVGRPSLATREKGKAVYQRYLSTLLSSLDANDEPHVGDGTD